MGPYIVGLTVAEALYWIDEQGCTVDYLEPNTEFGDVQATVDGGGVVIAPYGSHVDLSVPDDTVPSARPPGKVPYSTAVPAPPGADCSDATSFTHESLSGEEKQKFKIGSLSSDDLPFAVTVSASLGSIGVCKRGAIADIDAKLDLTPPPPQLKLGASDDSGKQTTAHVARYSFAPLGWHVSPGDGAQTFGSPTVEWSNSSSIEVSPALDLTANGKSPPDITLDLISVPVSPATAIVVDHGQPYLSATLGPTFSFGLTLNRKELQKLVEQAVALGLDASAAIAYVTVELGDEVGDALITFAPKIGPPGPLSPQGYEPDTQNLVAEIESETEAEYAQDIAELDGGVDAAETEEVIDNIIQFPGAAIEDVVDDAGESLVEVGPEALVAARDRAHLMLRIPPNPRLVPSKGKVTQASTLPVTPLQKLNPHEFVRAPLPSAQIAPTVRALLGLPVMASVGGLAVTTPRLQPGGKLSVVAPGLSQRGYRRRSGTRWSRLSRHPTAAGPFGRDRRNDRTSPQARGRPLDGRGRGPLWCDDRFERHAVRRGADPHGNLHGPLDAAHATGTVKRPLSATTKQHLAGFASAKHSSVARRRHAAFGDHEGGHRTVWLGAAPRRPGTPAGSGHIRRGRAVRACLALRVRPDHVLRRYFRATAATPILAWPSSKRTGHPLGCCGQPSAARSPAYAVPPALCVGSDLTGDRVERLVERKQRRVDDERSRQRQRVRQPQRPALAAEQRGTAGNDAIDWDHCDASIVEERIDGGVGSELERSHDRLCVHRSADEELVTCCQQRTKF